MPLVEARSALTRPWHAGHRIILSAWRPKASSMETLGQSPRLLTSQVSSRTSAMLAICARMSKISSLSEGRLVQADPSPGYQNGPFKKRHAGAWPLPGATERASFHRSRLRPAADPKELNKALNAISHSPRGSLRAVEWAPQVVTRQDPGRMRW